MYREVGLAALTVSLGLGYSHGLRAATQDRTPQAAPAATITIIGCVEPNEKSAGATTTTTGSSNDTKYKLTNSKPGKDAKGASDAKNSTARTYRLDAPDATISPEVGHQVEIVALVVPETAGPVGTSGSTSGDSAPKLRVETIKMVAATCPQ